MSSSEYLDLWIRSVAGWESILFSLLPNLLIMAGGSRLIAAMVEGAAVGGRVE